MTPIKERWRLHLTLLFLFTSIFILLSTQSLTALVVSEIMYHPVEVGGTPQGDESLEFIELFNNTAVSEDLTGYAFTNGIQYSFEPNTILGPKQYIVVAHDPNAVQTAYGITGVKGPFSGKLDNNGEIIELSNGNGEILISFEYHDSRPWPSSPDGTGHSLVFSKLGGDPEESSSWSPSKFIGGSPGANDINVIDSNARVVINELSPNSAGADWLELYNPGPVAVDLNKVYISEDRFNLLKFKVPSGVVLQPGQFWAVSKGTPPTGFDFGLGFAGETIYLTMANNDPVPKPLRVLDAFRYGVVPPETTIGRYPNGSDYVDFLSSPTYGTANAKPLVNDIVINEIMYNHPTGDDQYEYIELYNKGATTKNLDQWTFSDGVNYTFPAGTQMPAGSYLVIAKNPELLATVYNNLVIGSNLTGPFSGHLDDRSERIRLSYPMEANNPDTNLPETYMVTADEVTYYDGGRWPIWADGMGASMELRDPRGNNNTPDAWADSNENAKAAWEQFSWTTDPTDYNFSHNFVTVFDMMLLNQGEALLDDLELIIDGSNRITDAGFENGESSWRILGNHVQSFVTTEDKHSGTHCLHLIATGHGDPGANRINQSFTGVTASTVTFRGWARWLKGSPYLLLRTSYERTPYQPPRPAHSFELTVPLNLGTPGRQNTAYVPNRGPDILEVRHSPVLPASGEQIVVTARVLDNDGIGSVTLYYRSEGSSSFTSTEMVDNGSGRDSVAGDGIYTGIIPGASSGTMRAFYIQASDGSATTRFPTRLPATADVPDRTCLVRVGDPQLTAQNAIYRLWLSNDVLNIFDNRPNLSNESMDCTLVYNNTDVFYNAGIRFRGSPFLRSGCCYDPRGKFAFRLDFNPDQSFHGRQEINLDTTESSERGPLQERASFWFYKQMGLQFSSQEFVQVISNGYVNGIYEDVQKIDGDYAKKWFPDDDDFYIHKIDDYFEYSVDGTTFNYLDEGLKCDASHPPAKETNRWKLEKRSHRDNDNWDHLLKLVVNLNAQLNHPEGDPAYEASIESVIDPEQFARVLAVRHALGDWDSYGYRRGKNSGLFYSVSQDKWFLLPWDIDFTLGSGDGPGTDLFSKDAQEVPEIVRFLSYFKYWRMYMQAFSEMVNGPFQTSYGTGNPPTAFDRFLDDAANALIADGLGSGRRDGIKQFVRDRRAFILTQIQSAVFEITTNGGADFNTLSSPIKITGKTPVELTQISVNGQFLPVEFLGHNVFEVNVPLAVGTNLLTLQGYNGIGNPVAGATDSITVIYTPPCLVASITPRAVCNNNIVDVTIHGNNFDTNSVPLVTLFNYSDEIGFDALYVQNSEGFDQIDAATLLLNDPNDGIGEPNYAVHQWINLWNSGAHGEFIANEQSFAPPFNVDGQNYAVRFTGYIFAPSPGIRYFGVSSSDGFSLRIDNQLVGEYKDPRDADTTDVTKNITAGTMTFNFPAAGLYFMVLDYFENTAGEEIEFFQTDATGGNRKLINIDSELVVLRNNTTKINASDIVVVDANTINCRFNLHDAEADWWNIIVESQTNELLQCAFDNVLRISDCTPDYNADSQIDFFDWTQLANNWKITCFAPDWCDETDLDHSGSVDIFDVAIFAQEWLVGAR